MRLDLSLLRKMRNREFAKGEESCAHRTAWVRMYAAASRNETLEGYASTLEEMNGAALQQHGESENAGKGNKF